jgi:signal transduction histidine kinase
MPDPKVIEAVDSMRRLVDANLARVRARVGSSIGGADTRIRPLLDDLIEAFSHLYRDRGVAAEADVADDAVLPVPFDDLQEAVGNILENAFRHARRRVRVTMTGDGGPGLAIEDDGPGFGEDEIKAGRGLGLAIARDILAGHGYALVVSRAAGGGARVDLRPHSGPSGLA